MSLIIGDSTLPVFDVIVCGSLHLDIVVDAPHLPQIDETVPGSGWKKICGGKGGNQAAMAAKAGAKCAMIGRVGNDDFGQALVSNLTSNKVDATSVSVDPDHGSGMSVAIVNQAKDYGAVIVSGANLFIDPVDAATFWQKLGLARVLILQNEIPEQVNIAIAKVAKKSGAIVVLNAAPARQMSDDLLKLVDLLVVNRVEAEMMSGAAITDPQSAIDILPNISREGQVVIVTLGALGLVYLDKNREQHFIAPKKIQVQSTHGAGDCFVGVLAKELATGLDINTACNIANIAAANFVAGLGSS